MSEWQPIETAPKDETILLLNEYGRVGIGRLYDGETHPQHAVEGMGWATCGYCDPLLPGFTHWMPLPEPPIP